MMLFFDISPFLGSVFPKTEVIHSGLVTVVGLILMIMNWNVTGFYAAQTIFLRALPPVLLDFSCGGYQDASVVRLSSLLYVEAMFFVDVVAILLSELSFERGVLVMSAPMSESLANWVGSSFHE